MQVTVCGHANMAKWGKILSQEDTFDGDYLSKRKGRRGAAPAAKSQSGGIGLVVAASFLALAVVALLARGG